MPVTRRRLLQAMAAAGLLRGWPAFSAEALTFTVGSLPAPQHIQRVISAGAPADLLLMAAAPEKLLGFSSFDFSQTGNDLLPEAITRLPKLGRLAGRATTLSLEKLLALKPDLIVDCGNADETWTSQAQRISSQTQTPWLLIKGTLARTPQQLQAIGNALGVAFRTEPQAELARQFIEEAQSFAHSDAANVRFYAARGASGLETGLAGSLHTEAAELLGLRNVAQLPGRQGLAQVSLENLLAWQPDMILVQEAATLHTLTHDPVWQGVKAVAQKRILFLSGLPFGWLDAPPGINRLLGLRRLHAWLDKDVARSFEADMMRFATLFWHAPLSEVQFNRIVNAQ
ncbi:ABC transporter substrate-binding protein [Candidatus Symbiopectobacterium sp. NZEC127]|uniref:ABC transporter substrate-binding protein n=1 Tax=Candidatus Symbiopectobacterium sp. NZEC127 TaxID=2820472 RepID=UPI0022260F2E|nr:ABC transporter substrate-binding protein [Candidatus Symbiopectobacterium sp. NZEC127]MCW2486694.1 ABC transporter substrate-binding protein [Candidatus Symbiopectobacterium sp. NZEC127]